MSLQEKADTLTERLGARVCSAGVWKYDDTHKKVPVRTTTYPSNWIDNTNMLQVFLTKDTDLLCIDADGIPLDELEALYPTIKNTFTTQTTSPGKKHYWVKRGTLPATRIKASEYDIISSGFMFEGHSLKGQEQEWKIVNDVPLARLTQEEQRIIIDKRPRFDSNRAPLANVMFIDRAMYRGVKLVLENKQIDPIVTGEFKERDCVMKKAEWKPLALSLMNEEARKKAKGQKGRVQLPELNYMDFNTMAYKLSYNALISHEQRDEFLNLLLRDYYKIDPSSSNSRTYLKQMLCNLPRHEALDDLKENSETLLEDMQHTVVGKYGLVKYIDNKNIYFMEINTDSMKPRNLGKHDEPSYTLASIVQLRGIDKDYVASIPLVKILTDPFGPRVSYCDRSDIDTLNLAEHSIYYESAVPQPHYPDDVVGRVITSYMGRGKDRELYLHWLAHAMFGTRSPQTVPMLCTDKQVRGSTGKTTLAQGIPTRLITMCNTIEVSSTDTGYGDALVGKRLAAFNDVPRLSKSQWATLHGTIRDRTTAGARRMDNMKYGSFAVTSASLAFSWSSNWIPSIDSHDRRLWYVLPHNVEPYGTEPRLSAADSRKLNEIIENSSIEDYSLELQALANYLLHLYTNKKDEYYTQLFTEAPHTAGRDIALKSEKTYSEQLLEAIKEGPGALTDIIGTSEIAAENIRFITIQIIDYAITLPWEFMATLLHMLHPDDDMKLTKAKVASALQMETTQFTNRGTTRSKYHDRQYLIKQGLDPVHAEYSLQQCKIEVGAGLKDLYIDYLAKEI